MLFDPAGYVRALRFAAARHADQRVPDSDLPYLVHVASVAAETIAALDATRDEPGFAGRGSAAGWQRGVVDGDLAVGCALLHDTVEDTATTHAELVDLFGLAIADGVLALSKDASLPKPARMADSLRRIQRAPREVWMVKLADRITNLGPPPRFWPVDKRRAYHAEAITIADTLGPASPLLDARIRARIADYEAYLVD